MRSHVAKTKRSVISTKPRRERRPIERAKCEKSNLRDDPGRRRDETLRTRNRKTRRQTSPPTTPRRPQRLWGSPRNHGPRPGPHTTASIPEPLQAFVESLRAYVRTVAAHAVPEDPSSGTLTDTLLAPLYRWQSYIRLIQRCARQNCVPQHRDLMRVSSLFWFNATQCLVRGKF